MYDHDDEFCDDDCECYEEGYEEGYRRGRRASRPSRKQPQGCYIATAVYGSYDCPQVWTLRRFRDGYLKGSAAGRGFIRFYYALSPGVAACFGQREWIRRPVRKLLDRFVRILQRRGYSAVPYDDN